MAFKIFSKSEELEDNQYIEIDSLGVESKGKPGALGVRVEKLNQFEDTERVLRAIRSGEIVFLKIKGLREKDMGELKRCIDKLKKSIIANNGDIVGVEQDWLILTPENARVVREG
jgi:SepF-like predicted cell division protein (DUF552 family)